MSSKEKNKFQEKPNEIIIDPILTFHSIFREKKFLFKLTSLLSFITLIFVISKKPYFKSFQSFQSISRSEFNLFKEFTEKEIKKLNKINNYRYLKYDITFNSNNLSIDVITYFKTEKLAYENKDFMKNLFQIFIKNQYAEKQKIIGKLQIFSRRNLVSAKDKVINSHGKDNLTFIINKNYLDSVRQKLLFKNTQNLNVPLINKKDNFDTPEFNKNDYSKFNKNVIEYNEDMSKFDMNLVNYLNLDYEYVNNIYEQQKRILIAKDSKYEVEKINPDRIIFFFKYSLFSLIISCFLAFIKDRKYLFFRNK